MEQEATRGGPETATMMTEDLWLATRYESEKKGIGRERLVGMTKAQWS